MKKPLIYLLLVLFFLTLTQYKTDAIGKKDNKDQKKEEKQDESKKVEKLPLVESEYEPVLIGALLDNPKDFIDKKVRFRGRFSSFTTLALDYEPALRKSKDYISICIFRPDSNIPLSELKLAYPVEEAKEDQIIREMEEGDLIEVYAKVFSAALDEPWADILYLKKLESASKSSQDKIVDENKKEQEEKTLKKEEKKIKKSKFKPKNKIKEKE